MTDQPLVTVAILTYNGEVYLERILQQVTTQHIDGDVEVLVVDSGSTDSTLEIVRKFPSVRLHEIANSEFGHGKTRNLAARLAQGEFIAFLTHDAIPASAHWLKELLAPFAFDPRIVAVMGKQIPRAGCFPLLKYEIQGVFAGFGPDFGTSIFYKDDFVQSEGVLNAISFYSDVNSATRRDFLVNTLPYRDVRYAEDQLFGKDLIEAGYRKAYSGRAAVEHSNDLTLAEYRRRIFDETVGLRQIGFDIPVLTRANRSRLVARGVVGDTLRILRDRDFSWKRKLYWLLVNPVYQVQKWNSYRASTLVDLADEEALRSGSLEHLRKSA
ncbi:MULTISPECIES: glycosyltransferase family 2 protein [Cryobacterium]|uniref:Glycosyltransferase family 2 protein n=1 Tax=Cryobacterium breve TaxID=1259258 RepID=A0ABY2JA69_9MICO|nr:MULTISPECIES: glycosyltransferase family 2 protein [Cryobacterium]TFC90426.1 glycosyltransferase family 2 protein [Cryobacterium sp. TmT3-12]TFD01843.1 glycosyltransferase family 2 protein [Cryobacterium breve]